jgi:hypothetical protein
MMTRVPETCRSRLAGLGQEATVRRDECLSLPVLYRFGFCFLAVMRPSFASLTVLFPRGKQHLRRLVGIILG